MIPPKLPVVCRVYADVRRGRTGGTAFVKAKGRCNSYEPHLHLKFFK